MPCARRMISINFFLLHLRYRSLWNNYFLRLVKHYTHDSSLQDRGISFLVCFLSPHSFQLGIEFGHNLNTSPFCMVATVASFRLDVDAAIASNEVRV